eukprot:1785808-Pleurochrysis_carterae.AAC.3
MRIQEVSFDPIFDGAGGLKLRNFMMRHEIPLNDDWKEYCKNMKGKYDHFTVATCDVVDEACDSTYRTGFYGKRSHIFRMPFCKSLHTHVEFLFSRV